MLYILFTIFTFSSGLLLALAILPYNPNILLITLIGTLISICFSTIYSLISNILNHTILPYKSIFIIVTITYIPLSIIQGFILQEIYGTFSFIFSMILIMLFNLYLIYDLQILFNGNNYIIFESPIYPAISIYLDITNLYFTLIECLTMLYNYN